jgi:hypothetical protein
MKSYTLFAQRVMPEFQGTLGRLQSSRSWVTKTSGELTTQLNSGAARFAARHEGK